MSTSSEQILHDVFGFHDFRPGQAEVVDLLARGESALVVMPTGAGKSLCYQVPALMSGRLAIVVSPLVALMDDQVAALRANGVEAAAIHSGQSREEQVANWRSAAGGNTAILYMSPERLMTERMLAALERLAPSLFVVDEAHCISKWGANFRPEYEQLSILYERFPDAAIAGFTATADSATRDDIAEKLFRKRGRIIVRGFDRPNLFLGVASKSDWKRQLLAFLDDKRGEAGIVYCLSRRYTDEVAEFLKAEGYNSIAYHAGQQTETRKTNQNRFMSERAVIMVATIAFGMGIDKPDIRFVCHLNLPASMEAYYQEIGRAGRDGLAAETLMLYGLDDLRLRRQFVDQDGEDDSHKLREHKRLDSLIAYCEASQCRRQALLAYFDEQIKPCGNCDTCLDPPRMVDGSDAARMLFEAIRSTGQMFGTAHVIDVLRGADTAKIRDRGHERLSVYGAGAQHPKDYWQAFIRQAVAGAYLTINIQKYGALQITDRGARVADHREEFLLREITLSAGKSKKPKTSRAARAAEAAADLDIAGEDLLGRLKALRLELARERKVPAYVVFPDATLIEIASARPRSLDALAELNGVGPKKLADFGAAFLDVVERAGA